jgi:hypothetical protein
MIIMKSLGRHFQYLLAGLVLGFAVMPGVLWSLRERFALDVTGITDTGLTDYYQVFYSGLDEPTAWIWLLLPYILFIALRTLFLQRSPAVKNALPGTVTEESINKIEGVIATGGNVNASDKSGETRLHTASDECKPEIMTMLLNNGADLDACEIESGVRPLHKAAQKGCVQACDLLIRHGAKINAQTHDGATALHLAALAGHAGVVALLLKYHPNHALQDLNGRTALQCAQEAGHTDIASLLKQHIEKEWPYLQFANR